MDDFSLLQYLETFARLLVAALLGGLIGYEREHADKPTGVRDHVLVSVGSALFVLVGMYGFDAGTDSGRDPARVAAQVVTGIGFLGAGAILRTEGHVRGLTTAAGIWVTAAIGVAVALGGRFYLIAIFTTVLTLAVLFLTRFHQIGRDGLE
jgi:putative Mg2+ transporter-C (MgtC) family protein